MNFEIYSDDILLDPPTQRAAYSDRTAWLMAAMSWLAYLPFDKRAGTAQIREIAQGLSGETDIEAIIAALNKVASPGEGEAGRVKLETKLGDVGFKLIKTIDVSIGMRVDTQAYIAHIDTASAESEGRSDMLVLAFRGTQPTRIADLRTDIEATMTTVDTVDNTPARVHSGFLEAFLAVKDEINTIIRQYPSMPVYITGHSLGGALAVVAARYLANRSEGACYTYGCPRLCNYAFAQQIYTPLYRVVNASDGVPAVPLPGWAMKALTWLVMRSDWTKWLAKPFEGMSDYDHFGYQRHLSNTSRVKPDTGPAEFPGLKVRSNPTIWERFSGFTTGRIGVFERLMTPLRDHDISTYTEKLAWHALERHRRRHALNETVSSDTEESAASDTPSQ